MAANPRRPHRAPARRSAAAGFALIEVLVSLLLFSIGVLGMVAMQVKASAQSIAAEDRARAARLANELVTSLWAEQIASSSASTPSTYTQWQTRVKDSSSSGLPNATGVLASATDAVTGVVYSSVTITWKPPSSKSTDNPNTYYTEVVIP
jgi:type IV pilus assembly protein PilV